MFLKRLLNIQFRLRPRRHVGETPGYLKGYLGVCFIVILSLHAGFAYAGDEVGNLIDKEKEEMETWPDGDNGEDALPSMYLLGERGRVELYSDMAFRGTEIQICQSFPFDELVQSSRGEPGQGEFVLNTGISRVRDIITQTCLVRPGDTLLAVGRGENKLIQIKDFVVAPSEPVCPEDSPYILWGRFEPELTFDPLMFLTEMGYKEGDNGYQAAESLVLKGDRPEVSDWIGKNVPLWKDYDIQVYGVKAPNCDTIISMKLKTVSLEDVGLAGEMIYWIKGAEGGLLVMEKIEKDKKSGHVSFQGLMDFNGDQQADLVLHGDTNGCPYLSIFVGATMGFQAVEIPNRGCTCW